MDLFFFEFNMIFHGPADAFEPFIRNILSLPSRPVFCHMLGFDAQNPEVVHIARPSLTCMCAHPAPNTFHLFLPFPSL